MEKRPPLSSFLYFGAEVARPGELNCTLLFFFFFFFLTFCSNNHFLFIDLHLFLFPFYVAEAREFDKFNFGRV